MNTRLWKLLLCACGLLVVLAGCTASEAQSSAEAAAATAEIFVEEAPTAVEPTTEPTTEPTATPEELTAFQVAMTEDAQRQAVATPLPTVTPVPESCAAIDGQCIDLIYTDETCQYLGPEELESGQIVLLFHNNGTTVSAPLISRLGPDRTVAEFRGRVPNGSDGWVWVSWAQPRFSYSAPLPVQPDQSSYWQGNSIIGTYVITCHAKFTQSESDLYHWPSYATYFGGSFIVED